jgi:hypothetical protein
MKILFGGGVNESETPNINEGASGSQNFDLEKDSYKMVPRAPFDLLGTSTNAGDIRGFVQLVKRDDTETTLVQSGGVVYKWNGSSTFSSAGTCSATSQLRGTYWSLGDYAVVTDIQKLTPVSTWDGTTFGTLSTGLGVSLYAKYGIVHKGRVWLFNVTTSTDTPHLMVASAFENPQSYDITKRASTSGTFSSGNEAFYMLTPDLRPINGVAITISGDLVISTFEGRLFKLTGSTATDFAFVPFYPQSQAVGDESLSSTGNDIIYMGRGGRIDLLSATQNYGDVAADDLSRFIKDTTLNLNDAITVYDQTNQKVLMFVTGKVLVLFKDILYGGAVTDENGTKAKLSPWSIYTTQDAASFETSAAIYMRRPGTTEYSVFFGDNTGRIFDLNGDGTGDAGTYPIFVKRTTRYINKAEVDFMRSITKGSVQYRRMYELDFSIELDFGDEYSNPTTTVVLKGASPGDSGAYFGDDIYFGGSNYFSEGFTFANKISHTNFSSVGKGPGAFATFTTESTVNTYQVDNVELM